MRPLRVYRVVLNLSRAGAPGAGRPAWKLRGMPGVETLVVTRRRAQCHEPQATWPGTSDEIWE